eukprot:756089-Hanusia_phi.AAC.2
MRQEAEEFEKEAKTFKSFEVQQECIVCFYGRVRQLTVSSTQSGSFDSLSDTESKTERDNVAHPEPSERKDLARGGKPTCSKGLTTKQARLEQLKKKNEFLLQGSQGFQGRGNGSPYKQPARVKATGRKEEERGDMQELSDGVVNSDWIQHVLPEISESSEDENPRLHEASAKLAGHLAKFRDEERFKERLKEGESLLHNIKSMTEMLHKTAGGEQVGMAQEQIAKEVKKLRKHVVDEVKGIYKDISRARDLLLNASDADTDTLRKDAQRLVMNAESRTIALRASFRTRDDLRLDFLPQHLRDFLFETASAQTLYDRARIEAVRIKTEMMEVEARKARERAARRQRFMQLGQTSSSLDQSRPDEDLSLLSQEETHLLKSLLEEVVGLNESIDAAYEKLENAKGAEEGEMGTAADMAERAQKQLEDALYRMKMFRRQLLSERVRPIRHALPPHLRNIMSANFPMLQLWREGLTELPVCEAINGMETLDAKIGEAKRLVDDLEAGRVGPEREAEAMELLQGAIALGVAVKEKALASMLDKSIGGQQLKLRRFPRHVQNLIVAEEPVLVLWEKGVIDPQICKWLDTLSDILRMYRKSRELGSQLEGLGESEGAALSRQIDELQHKADERVSGLREEVARGPTSPPPAHLAQGPPTWRVPVPGGKVGPDDGDLRAAREEADEGAEADGRAAVAGEKDAGPAKQVELDQRRRGAGPASTGRAAAYPCEDLHGADAGQRALAHAPVRHRAGGGGDGGRDDQRGDVRRRTERVGDPPGADQPSEEEHATAQAEDTEEGGRGVGGIAGTSCCAASSPCWRGAVPGSGHHEDKEA